MQIQPKYRLHLADISGNISASDQVAETCDACDRNDGFQTLDTGGSDCEIGRAAVGTAGHSNVAVRPVSLNLNIATVLSDDFLDFDENINSSMRSNIVF